MTSQDHPRAGGKLDALTSAPSIPLSPRGPAQSHHLRTHSISPCLLPSPRKSSLTIPSFPVNVSPGTSGMLVPLPNSPRVSAQAAPPADQPAQPVSPRYSATDAAGLQTSQYSAQAALPAASHALAQPMGPPQPVAAAPSQRPVVRQMGSEFGEVAAGVWQQQPPQHGRTPSDMQQIDSTFSLDNVSPPAFAARRLVSARSSNNPFDDENFYDHMAGLSMREPFQSATGSRLNDSQPVSPALQAMPHPLLHPTSSAGTVPHYHLSPHASQMAHAQAYSHTQPFGAAPAPSSASQMSSGLYGVSPQASLTRPSYVRHSRTGSATHLGGPPMRLASRDGAGTPKRHSEAHASAGGGNADYHFLHGDAANAAAARGGGGGSDDAQSAPLPSASHATTTLYASVSHVPQSASARCNDLTAPVRPSHQRTRSNNPFLGKLDMTGADNPATATQQQAIKAVEEDEWYRTKPVATSVVEDGTLRVFSLFHAVRCPSRFCMAVLMLEVKNNTGLDLGGTAWHVSLAPNAVGAQVCPPFSLKFELSDKLRALVPIEYRAVALDAASQSMLLAVTLVCEALGLRQQFDVLWPMKVDTPLV